MNYKIILWKLGLKKSDVCPICNSRLVKKGFKGHNQYYVCPFTNCEFNK